MAYVGWQVRPSLKLCTCNVSLECTSRATCNVEPVLRVAQMAKARGPRYLKSATLPAAVPSRANSMLRVPHRRFAAPRDHEIFYYWFMIHDVRVVVKVKRRRRRARGERRAASGVRGGGGRHGTLAALGL